MAHDYAGNRYYGNKPFALRLDPERRERWQRAIEGTSVTSLSRWIRDLVDVALDIAGDLNAPGSQVRIENYMRFLEVVERLKRPR